METIKYFTLADVQRENPTEFNAAIKQAVNEAAFIVGKEVLLEAFSYQHGTANHACLAA